MSTPVIGVTADATIEEAAALMMDKGFTTLPVFSGSGRLIGLITEADLGGARYTPGPRRAPEPEDGVLVGIAIRLVKQVMRAPALAIPADADLTDLATAMVEAHQRCIPVVDRQLVVGMVSWRDLLARLDRES